MRARQNRRSVRRCRRRGYVLVIFALLFVGLMALAALVIDLGLARMTQRQMQTAADAAALEGLRGRDRLDLADPDATRRQAASNLVGQVFDDDLDTLAGDPRAFGAGPRIELTGGIALSAEFSAAQLITLLDPPVYDPVVALNAGNSIEGDLVAGDYDETSGLTHREQNDYTRDDFSPTTDADDAFLTRLRRTSETLDPAIGQSGGPIPYLFGRGSLLNLDSRGRGVSVRSTAIAQARRAKAVGRSDGPNNLPGALAVALTRTAWETNLTVDSPATITVNADGTVSASGATAGQVIEATGAGQVVSLGDLAFDATMPIVPTPDPTSFVATAVAAAPVAPLAQVYVPIIAAADDPLIPSRVIGFGLAEITTLGGEQFQLTLREGRLANANATPVPVHVLDPAFFADAVSDPELAELLLQHNAQLSPLLAPALAR